MDQCWRRRGPPIGSIPLHLFQNPTNHCRKCRGDYEAWKSSNGATCNCDPCLLCFSRVGQTEPLEGTDHAAKNEEGGDDGLTLNNNSEDGETVEKASYSTGPADVLSNAEVAVDDETGGDATNALKGLTLGYGGMNVGPFHVSSWWRLWRTHFAQVRESRRSRWPCFSILQDAGQHGIDTDSNI